MSQEIINKKNIESIHANTQLQQAKIDKLTNEVNVLRTTCSQLMNSMVELQQKIAIMKAQSMGAGSTVGGN